MSEKEIILIVEDSSVNREMLSRLLSRHGYRVWDAGCGQSALEALEQGLPDLIVLDIMMENLFSGLEVCKRLRMTPQLKDIPVIGVSGIGDELDVHLSRWGDNEYFPVDEYFEKPLDRQKLLESVRLRINRGVRKRH